ncbi:hypothetical protein [Nocardioides sp. WS12]|uniref:hypothetical protein n=1 Tax=Nocardioides sp. WS12 TaxID=2486272 RepID=UPI0015FDE3A1|nr:hypothetical protein [Nocardioides sp. WS12]
MSTTSGLTFRDRQGHRIGTLSVANVLAWLAIVAPIVIAAQVIRTAAPASPWWPAVVLVLLAVATADLPDSMFPLSTVLATAGWWIATVEDVRLGPTVVVALSLLVFHVAAGHAALGPPGRDDDAAVLRGVVARIAQVGALTVVLAAVAGVTTGRVDVPPVVLGLALISTGALPWLAGRWKRFGAGH